MKIPFDVKWKSQIESGEYRVETRAGCPVRIVCWDMACELPILGLVLLNDEKTEEIAVGFTNEGTNLLGEPLYDSLFIVTPEPELTEWQRFISACLQKYGLLDCGAADRIAKECSAELLDLARKELENEAPSIIHAKSFNAGLKQGKAEAVEKYKQSWYNEGKIYGRIEGLTEDEKYQQGVHDGKEEAMKGLPRWKKAAQAFGNYVVAPTETGEYCLLIDGYFIMLSDLEKLPKDE